MPAIPPRLQPSGFFQDRLFNAPEATHFRPHLDLGMTVGFQDRLGQIPQEVIIAIAVRHPREFHRDPLHEGVLLVRHPEDDPLAQFLGPLLCLSDQSSNLFFVAEIKGSANQTRFWVSSRTA